MGSMIQLSGRSAPSCPASSPRMPWSGNRARIRGADQLLGRTVGLRDGIEPPRAAFVGDLDRPAKILQDFATGLLGGPQANSTKSMRLALFIHRIVTRTHSKATAGSCPHRPPCTACPRYGEPASPAPRRVRSMSSRACTAWRRCLSSAVERSVFGSARGSQSGAAWDRPKSDCSGSARTAWSMCRTAECIIR